MKRIETNLTEKQFFANLEQFCRSTSRLYEECNSFETFVYKIKDRDYSQQDCDTDENSQQ